MLTPQERIFQKKMEAKLQAQINERKSKSVIRCGANLASQWGRVVDNEQRLIDNGHFMKTGEMAKKDHDRDQEKSRKQKEKKVEVVFNVSTRHKK